ncbi:PREDICTED: uncharacterized protein LOC102020497 [Chinchilla lanigera]|uniref:uncharacterized protein LOC102020497 n=1 Tax=Chinchilla lanigera TaxID=34839 RepID=UPI0006963AA0|nr:PREDICTED: uncharacterized protein LOC102020497 [Chinchilla lanigera]
MCSLTGNRTRAAASTRHYERILKIWRGSRTHDQSSQDQAESKAASSKVFAKTSRKNLRLVTHALLVEDVGRPVRSSKEVRGAPALNPARREQHGQEWRPLAFIVDSSTAKIANVPKTRKTFCKKCGKHQPHKVTQYEKGKDSLNAQGKRHYDRKQSGCSAQTKPSCLKKANATENTALRLACVEPNCSLERKLARKRCKHFELGGENKRKGQVIQF